MLTTIREENGLPSDFNKRKGYFLVSRDLLDLATNELMLFMANFLIVKAQFMYETNCMEYTALSRLFDAVEEAHQIPQYTFNITKKSNGSIKISTVKVEPAEEGSKGTGLLRLLRKLDG